MDGQTAELIGIIGGALGGAVLIFFVTLGCFTCCRRGLNAFASHAARAPSPFNTSVLRGLSRVNIIPDSPEERPRASSRRAHSETQDGYQSGALRGHQGETRSVSG